MNSKQNQYGQCLSESDNAGCIYERVLIVLSTMKLSRD